MINYDSLLKISYGLYVVCSGTKEKGNGYISNTVFQVTSDPPRFATCCNKDNHTAGLIQSSGQFSVSVLREDASAGTIGTFGFKSGKDADKLEGMDVRYGETGVPIVMNDAIAFLEFKVEETLDVGTHLMFIGKLVVAEVLDPDADPLTYLHYRRHKKGVAPKNAPTYIDKSKLEKKSDGVEYGKYECPACGYIYDEEKEGVKFDDLPDDWECPVCGEEKSEFIKL
ncbi:MAG: High molecular weight rubredoxin [Bacteroidia bacterium]|nr:MAG: High molecular weight rubredoxin [Bacteroidia bacterium]